VLRSTPAIGLLLAVHIGIVFAQFITHALWQVRPRLLPLPRSRQIRKRKADGIAASGGKLDAPLI